jgi:acyl dehydratase
MSTSEDSERREGRITDEGIARLRERIGVPKPLPQPPHYQCPNEDIFRNLSHSIGDDNPLYCEPAYAEKTRWGGLILHPAFVGCDTLIGIDEVDAVPPDKLGVMRGDPLRGVHAFYSSGVREWWRPLRPNRRVFRRNAVVGIQEKQSEFAKRSVHEWTANVFADEVGELLSTQYRLMIRAERESARKEKKYKDSKPAPYTEEQLEEIDAQYASEKARGDEARYWEDVDEGDELRPLVKGPLTVTDIVCWHVGVGMGYYGVKALRLGFANRQRIPGFYQPDALNIPDQMMRVHWDDTYAQLAGAPTMYDYGRMRECWLVHLCTDWMGDSGWLWKLDCEFRRFNFVGDTQWMRGRVERKYLAEGDRPAVDLEIWGENQRGEITTPGHASILLPSRERGEVRLPDPPGQATDLQSALDALAQRFADDEG